MGTSITSYRELIVWQKAMDTVIEIYRVTAHYPKHEQYSLIDQTRRAAVSIPANIAEGQHRGTKKDFCYFLHIAYGSAAELETHVEIAIRLMYCTPEDVREAQKILTEVKRMLNALIRKLSARTPSASNH